MKNKRGKFCRIIKVWQFFIYWKQGNRFNISNFFFNFQLKKSYSTGCSKVNAINLWTFRYILPAGKFIMICKFTVLSNTVLIYEAKSHICFPLICLTLMRDPQYPAMIYKLPQKLATRGTVHQPSSLVTMSLNVTKNYSWGKPKGFNNYFICMFCFQVRWCYACYLV